MNILQTVNFLHDGVLHSNGDDIAYSNLLIYAKSSSLYLIVSNLQTYRIVQFYNNINAVGYVQYNGIKEINKFLKQFRAAYIKYRYKCWNHMQLHFTENKNALADYLINKIKVFDYIYTLDWKKYKNAKQELMFNKIDIKIDDKRYSKFFIDNIFIYFDNNKCSYCIDPNNDFLYFKDDRKNKHNYAIILPARITHPIK